ncbi:MAG: hypothetical protein ACRC0Y_11125 [Fusobacteriaceae bacterium]
MEEDLIEVGDEIVERSTDQEISESQEVAPIENITDTQPVKEMSETTGTEQVLSQSFDLKFATLQNNLEDMNKNVNNLTSAMANLMTRINIVEDVQDNVIEPVNLSTTLDVFNYG